MIKIFSRTNLTVEKNSRRLGSQGFSLIEIAIVIFIIGGLLSVALPRMQLKKIDTRKVIREITVTLKEVRNRAKLYGTTYRLAFRLDADNQAYWVEKSNNVTYIDKEALEKARSEAKSSFREDEKEKVPTAFQPDSGFFKKEQKLPAGYHFKLVEAQNESYSDGMAYIHIFSQGFIEAALIQIEDPKKNIWSVTFNTLTGQAAIIPEAKTLKEIQP